MNARQEAYLKPSSKKPHVLTVGGIMAAAAGIQFFELENGVIISRGVNGLIPPCCISGVPPNTTMGRRCLDLDAAKADNPKVVPTSVLPSHGPPILVQGTRLKGNQMVPAKAKAVLTPRRKPPRDSPSGMCMPEVHPLSQPTTHSATTSERLRNTRSPTPSQLSLPELERPPSWDFATVRDSPSPPIVPTRMRTHSIAANELDRLPPGYLSHASIASVRTQTSHDNFSSIEQLSTEQFGSQHAQGMIDPQPFVKATLRPRSTNQMTMPASHFNQPRQPDPRAEYARNAFSVFSHMETAQQQFRPPHQIRPVPQCPNTPYGAQPRPTFRPDQVMTYAEVEAILNARLNPPPPILAQKDHMYQQSMLQPQSMLQTQSMLQPQSMLQQQPMSHAPQAMFQTPTNALGEGHSSTATTIDPVLNRLTQEAYGPMQLDIASVEEQLGLPHNPKFADLVARARQFDMPASQGGWRPRPPPTPLNPADHAKLPYSQQRKGEQTYHSRVRRANIPHHQQKRDAWTGLQWRILEAAHVIYHGCFWLFSCAQQIFPVVGVKKTRTTIPMELG